LAARPGDEIEIGGPRGSVIVADDFDWYLLIGDETALPAIGRWVESLRAGVPVKTIAVLSDDAERQTFARRAARRAAWQAVWVCRDGKQADDARLLQDALAASGPLPDGDGYVWIAAQAHVARTLRTYVLETPGHKKTWVKASGYWVTGQAAAHVNMEDRSTSRASP
jgi:NADPH-dependent ferric siderophore reductase